MTARTLTQDDPLDDFDRREFTLHGATKTVYVAGQGPAVIVMTEMPGISPHVARFARWVRDAGFTVYMPSLFGRDGAVASAEEGATVFKRACISAESARWPTARPRRSCSGCARSPAWRMSSRVDRASARSACASPATLPCR